MRIVDVTISPSPKVGSGQHFGVDQYSVRPPDGHGSPFPCETYLFFFFFFFFFRGFPTNGHCMNHGAFDPPPFVETLHLAPLEAKDESATGAFVVERPSFGGGHHGRLPAGSGQRLGEARISEIRVPHWEPVPPKREPHVILQRECPHSVWKPVV